MNIILILFDGINSDCANYLIWLATARQRPKPGAPDLAACVVADVEETFSRDQAKSSYFPEIPAKYCLAPPVSALA